MANLTDITEVEPLSAKDAPLIQEVISVLRKHNALDRFGLTLLHQHFDLSHEEVLVERTDPVTRTQIVKPYPKTQAEQARAIGTAWRFDSGQALTFCMCLDQNEARGDAIAMPISCEARPSPIPPQYSKQPELLEARWNDLAKARLKHE